MSKLIAPRFRWRIALTLLGLAAGGSLAAIYTSGLLDSVFDGPTQSSDRIAAGSSFAGPSAAYKAATVAGISPTYGLQVHWTSPVNAKLLAVGDMDGNGRDDLVALSANVGTPGWSLQLSMQSAAGVLAAPVVIPLPDGFDGSKVMNLVTADFNEDGRADLLLGHSALAGLHYLLSNAQGGLDWRTDDWSNLVSTVLPEVADIDGDGHLDVLTSASYVAVYPAFESAEQRLTYFGDGLGSFERHRAESAGEVARDLALGDFNNDGSPDLASTAVGLDEHPHAVVHPNDGEGVFLPGTTLDAKEGFDFPIVDAGDLTGDGRVDVVLHEFERVAVHSQLPNGSIDRFGDWYGVWSFGEELRIVDLDGDGRKDLIHPYGFGPSVWYYLQDEYGFRHARKIPFPIGGVLAQYSPTSMVVGDFNGDGINDTAIATSKSGMVMLIGSLTPYAGAGGLPGAPTITSPVLDPTSSYPDFKLTVNVGPPANDGGESITGYSVFSVPSGAVDLDAGSAVATHRIRQLEDNRSYTFHARAHNAAGLGPPSASSPALVLGTPEASEPLPNLRVHWVGNNEMDIGTFPQSMSIRLDRPAPPGGVHLDLATSNGTATAGADYGDMAKPGLTIPEGLMESAPFTVNFLGDLLVEPDETFTINMTNVQGAALAAYQGVITIYDDDEPLTRIAVGYSQVAEGNSGSKTVWVPVTLSNPFPTNVTFDLRADCYSCGVGDFDEFDLDDVMIAAGATSVLIPVTIHGDGVYEPDERISLWLDDLKPAGDINVMHAYQWVGQVTIINDDAVPVLSVGDASLQEGNQGHSGLKFTASLSAPLPVDAYFSAETIDGSGTSGSDYIAQHRAGIYIPAGETSQDIVVQVVGDTRFETNETFTLKLRDPHNVVIADGVGVGTLLNDDVAGGIAIDDSQVVEGDSGAKQLVFNVRLSQPSASPVTFDAFTSPGTAQPGIDFLPQSANGLVITAGSTLVTFTVPILGDVNVENHESFVVELANVAGASVTKGQGRGVIVNDDRPTISINNVSVVEMNEGEHVPARFVITLSEPSPTPVTLVATIAPGGTASPGYDHSYAPTPSTIVIDAGRSSRVIEVLVFGNNVPEGTETFTVMLSAPNGATILDGVGVGTIVDNDSAAMKATGKSGKLPVTRKARVH